MKKEVSHPRDRAAYFEVGGGGLTRSLKGEVGAGVGGGVG